jgi:ABC-type Fe3+/spermidine/putrescine transport system ATPase subunit
MTHLTLQAVTKRFNAAYAVDRVDLSVPDGKLVCFLGPSGCGKTTLLRMIAGLETPSSGRPARLRHGVSVAGVVSAYERRRKYRVPAAASEDG